MNARERAERGFETRPIGVAVTQYESFIEWLTEIIIAAEEARVAAIVEIIEDVDIKTRKEILEAIEKMNEEARSQAQGEGEKSTINKGDNL